MSTQPALTTVDASPAPEVNTGMLAAWQTRVPWLWAIALGIGGTLLTAFGSGYSQVRQLDPLAATYAQSAFIAFSALLGLAVMWRTRPFLAEYGFRRPRQLNRTLWLLPLAVLPAITVGFAGVHVTPAHAAAYLVLAAAVGFNEEIWFRGLVLASLRRLGERPTIVGGSAVFGVLHLANVFTGRDPLYLALQLAFACLVGLVLAEIVAITRSLWIGIGWHLVYDLAALSTGDELSPTALAGLALMTAVLVAYAGWLWRQIPAHDPR